MRHVFVWLFVILLTACSPSNRIDPEQIYGRWVSETKYMGDFGIPMGPDIVINRHDLNIKNLDKTVAFDRIEVKDGNIFEIVFFMGISLRLKMISNDKLEFEIPIQGNKIIYNKVPNVKSENTANITTETQNQKPPNPTTEPSAPVSSVSSTSAENVENLRLYEEAKRYAQAGNNDEAIRYLNEALQTGYKNWDQLEKEPMFVQLRTDVRYKAVLSRWKS